MFCGVIVSVFLPTPHIPPTHRSLLSGLASLDWLGTALLIGSVTTLIFGFSFHTSYLEPWSSSTVWGMLLASVLSAAAFVLVEMKVKRPLVPLRVFKSKHISAVMLSGFFLSVSNQAFVSLYFLHPVVSNDIPHFLCRCIKCESLSTYWYHFAHVAINSQPCILCGYS